MGGGSVTASVLHVLTWRQMKCCIIYSPPHPLYPFLILFIFFLHLFPWEFLDGPYSITFLSIVLGNILLIHVFQLCCLMMRWLFTITQIMPCVLFFYHCVANYYKLTSLNQHPFISSAFCKLAQCDTEFSLRESQGWDRVISHVPSRHLFHTHSSCWQGQFLVDIAVRTLFPWQLLARALSQFFKIPWIPSHMTFCTFKSNPLHSSNLWLLLPPPAGKSSLLRKALLVKS